MPDATDKHPLRLGVSACLLGQPVRYDGGHKLDRWITGELGRFVTFVPVCPEVEAGLGLPREAMRLVGDPAAPRLVTVRTGRDFTDRLQAWAEARIEELARENLCGFLFKSRSPSSGMARVKVYPPDGGMPVNAGTGLFARVFQERFPLLPVEEEGRLNDPGLRENFIERIFALRRFRAILDRDHPDGPDRAGSPAALVGFHAAHKLQIMAHSPRHLRLMGALVAQAGTLPAGELFSRYRGLLLEALAVAATPARNANALQHMAGYFKKLVTAEERAELAQVIDEYRLGLVPLVAPVTLVRHLARLHRVEYLTGQRYLEPHPVELKLRNHA